MNSDGFASLSIRRLAYLFIAIGLLVAVDSYLELFFVYKLWPLLVAMVGMGLIGIFVKGNARVPTFLVSGVYLVCFSGLALYCSFTSWAEIALLWPLFITFLGIVFLALFFFQENRRVYILLGLLLISLSVVFFLTQTLGANWWWTVLVLAGLSILFAEKAT